MSSTRTETIVRSYGKDGQLVAETTTVVTVAVPATDDERTGLYL